MGKQNNKRSIAKPGPKRKYMPLIRKTAKLIAGRQFRISLPSLGVVAYGTLCWDTEDHPDIDVVNYRALDDTPNYFKRLVRKSLEYGGDLLHDEVSNAVLKSEPFKRMKQEIRAICDESDRLEKEDPDFTWEESILDHAEQAELYR